MSPQQLADGDGDQDDDDAVNNNLVMLRTIFHFALGPPFPPGGPGEGPDCHFPSHTEVLGPFRPGSGGGLIYLVF